MLGTPLCDLPQRDRDVAQEAIYGESHRVQLKDQPLAPTSYAQSSRNQKSTRATTFRPGVLDDTVSRELVTHEIRSEPETLSSWASLETSNETIYIPLRPVDGDGEELEDFECPYCYTLIHVRSRHTWKYVKE